MAYNEQLANRVRELIAERIVDEVEEKSMFGGISFMIRGKIAVGIKSDRIMVRIAPGIFDEAALGEGCVPMNHGGRDMKGFLFVTEDVLGTRAKLKHWVDLALDYNEQAAQERPEKKAVAKKKAMAKKTDVAERAAVANKKAVAMKKAASKEKAAPTKKATPKKKAASGKGKR